MDCESVRPEIDDLALGRRAIGGYCAQLERVGWRATFFVVPEQLAPMADLLGTAIETGHEVGVPLPLTAQVMEMMQALKVDGKAANDHSGLVQYYEKIAQFEARRFSGKESTGT